MSLPTALAASPTLSHHAVLLSPTTQLWVSLRMTRGESVVNAAK